MKKRVFTLILVLCTAVLLFAGCGSKKEPLSTAEVVQIVLDDMKMSVEQVQPHVHSGTFEGEECYYVYVTVDGRALAYAIDTYTGEILDISDSTHNH